MRTRVIQEGTATALPTTSAERRPAATTAREGREKRLRGAPITAFVRRHPLPVFFGIAFACTWATVPFGMFMAAGPLVAALVVTGVVDGRTGLRRLGTSMLRWRVRWYWYPAAVLIPLGVALGTAALNVSLGAPSSVLGGLELSALVLMFVMRLVVPLFAPVGEEPGWRGFALPRLQRRHSPLVSTLILGVVVAAWHLPLVFLAQEHLAPVFLVATVAVTFFYTWIFNHTGGSVLMTIIAHAAEGVVTPALVGQDGFVGPSLTSFTLLYTAGWCAVAVAVVVFDRNSWRSRSVGSAHADRG